MSDQNPYEKLEVADDASFEAIQTARDRLIERHQDDERCREEIEAAYDAVLMDRLRKRQEGKIKVPEGVRTADRLAEQPSKLSLPQLDRTPPSWVQRALDQPTPQEVMIVGGIFTALAVISFTAPSSNTSDLSVLLLALGVGFTMYWLNRKEQKLGRAVLLTLAALFMGGVISAVLMQFGLPVNTMDPEALVSLIVFLCLWLTSSFLR